jgi:hypothetical protein
MLTEAILRNLISNLDAQVIPKKITAFGKVGIYTYLILAKGNNIHWIFNVNSDIENQQSIFYNFILGLKNQYKSIKNARFSKNALEIIIVPRYFEKEAVELSHKINLFLTNNKFRPCCLQSGSNENLGVYGLTNRPGALILSEETASRFNNELEQKDSNTKEERVIFGTLGALIGTIPGIILYVILYFANFLAAISSLLVVVGAMFLYEKFATKFSKTGAIITILVSLLVVTIIQPWIAYSLALYVYNEEFNQLGFFITFIETPFVIFNVQELFNIYLKDLAISLVLGFIGTFAYVKNKVVRTTTSTRLEKIDLA